MNLSTLEQTILRTIVYFDLFSYSLTELEIWKWQLHDRNYESGIMNQGYRLAEIVETIEKSEALKNVLDFNNGFYYLKGREGLVEERKRRYVISDHKYKRAKFWIGFLQYAPFVRAIAICNNLSYHNAKDSSDIDLLVITEPEHIWTARFFLTGFLKLFRLRPGDRKKYFEKFSADNLLVKKNLLAGLAPLFHPRRQLQYYAPGGWLQKIGEIFFLTLLFIEKYLEKLQRRILA